MLVLPGYWLANRTAPMSKSQSLAVFQSLLTAWTSNSVAVVAG